VRYTAPATPVVLDQKACWYSPNLIGLQVGQPLEVRNSDETLHNVHAWPRKPRASTSACRTKA
jgi:plastocyanin